MSGPSLHDEALAAQTLLRAMRSSEDHDETDEEIVVASETNLREAIELALLANAEDAAHVEGIKVILAGFDARLARKVARIERRKGAILAAMEIAGLQKLELAAGTVSVGKGSRKVIIITDAEQIPDKFMRETISRSPDKKAIGDALAAKEQVPGAELSNQMPTLTVRVR